MGRVTAGLRAMISAAADYETPHPCTGKSVNIWRDVRARGREAFDI